MTARNQKTRKSNNRSATIEHLTIGDLRTGPAITHPGRNLLGDGTYKKTGNPVEEGVYYYIAQAEGYDGEISEVTGFLQLMR